MTLALGTSFAFAADVDGEVVVLDVRADRYFLVRNGDGSRERVATSRPGPFEVDLSVQGWRPAGSVWAAPSWRLKPAAIALACVKRVSDLLDHHSFEDLVSAVADAPVVNAQKQPDVAVLVASYEASRPLFSRSRVCRLDAPALCLLMRRFGYAARLIFGVRLQPFAGHCWAELDGCVLNEPHEAVVRYTPVLAV